MPLPVLMHGHFTCSNAWALFLVNVKSCIELWVGKMYLKNKNS
jgi:hypothetical protein